MLELVMEYRQGVAALRGRIAEINERLAGREALREGESVQTLQTRRYLLYQEAAEMEEAIRAMQEHGAEPASVAGL